MSSTRWERIAQAGAGPDYASVYAERFRSLAADGHDIHGEATFVSGLATPPDRVLDAGCGTGRIGVRLAELGYAVTGVDVDARMLAEARAAAPELTWHEGDLATLDLGETFDVVLLAGNIIPLLEPGTLPAVAERLAAHMTSGGLVVCGFGLDRAHLPGTCPVTPLADFESAMQAAGLVPEDRFGSWERGTFVEAEGYVVTVHRLPAVEA